MTKKGIKNNVKRLLCAAIVLFSLAFFTACTSYEARTLPAVEDYMLNNIVETKELRVGVVAGPYWDMFEQAILTSLTEMGYTATPVYFHDFSGPNFALANHTIDINVFQHYLFLNTFKFNNNLALTAIMEIPTVSMGVFSHTYRSLQEIPHGASVSIPDDPTNLARALMVLESANVITLNPAIDKQRAVVSDIVSNPLNLQFTALPAHHLVDALEWNEVSVINGNYALSSGLSLSDSLYQELLLQNYMNVVAVRTEDLNKQFVRDIIEIIYSENFISIVTDPRGDFAGFQWPRWLHDIMDEAK
jgi:D-methionine transport system substrate-binding protein